MQIRPITIPNYTQKTLKKQANFISNPTIQEFHYEHKDYPVSFYGILPNSVLQDKGYKIANIADKKIVNNDDAIIISTAEKLIALTNSPSCWNKKIVLTDDINLNGAEIRPIGSNAKPFKGEFDGNGCKISNFRINIPEGRNIGLFAKIENAKISNLDVSEASIKGKQQVGGLTGYAKNSDFNNCRFNGYIEGEKKVGGLIALGRQNKITDCGTNGIIKVKDDSICDNMFGYNTHQFSISGIAGGILSADEESSINKSYSTCKIMGNEQIGGLVGYSERTTIKDCCFNGTISGKQKTGGIIGWGVNSQIIDSYSLSNKKNLISENNRCTNKNSYFSLTDVLKKPLKEWDKNVWNLEIDRLPRLFSQEKTYSPEKIFIEDINIDIETQKIKNPLLDTDFTTITEKIPLNIFPPKHFPSNDAFLTEIRECKNPEILYNSFISFISNNMYINSETKEIKEEYKEILLEFIKNPKMDLNKRSKVGYSIRCTPLFIITTINEPYILQEALKRDDVNPTIGSGSSGNKTITERAFNNHIDPCVYVLLTSPKMKDIIEPQIEILKTGNISKVSRLMLESYPNLPQYDEVSGCINFSKEIEIPEEFKQKTKKVTRLQDVQKNGFIDSNYRDSRGNNIANVLTTHDDEEEALSILISAQKKGTDLNNRNKKYETPIGNALYNKMPHIVANLLPITDMPFVRVSGGIDSMLLFSNLENDTLSTNYMNIAKSRGLSVNSSDETGNTPLINAVNNGNITAMRFLLSSGANPNVADNFGQTALHHACINNNIEAINLLLDFYAYPLITDLDGLIPEDYLDIDVKNSLSSRFQEIYNIYELSDMNIKYNGSLEKTNCDNSYRLYNIDKLSSQILSGQNVDYEILNLTKNILQNQDVMQFKDGNQNTILHLIAQSNSKYANEALKTVIDKGINLDAKNSLGETALISALNEFICTTNIEHKINLLRNIKTLLDSDINVDSVDYNKQSALHKICQSGNIILFNEILKKNPKITQFDSNNKSAFEYIPLNKKNEMNYILKKYLENSNILKEKNNND